jgi:carbonic anhydrase/acetyltransferase-like protein (isoleucine patch superfamily)
MTTPSAPPPAPSGMLVRSRVANRKGIARRIVMFLRGMVLDGLVLFYRKGMGMDLHPSCRVSLRAKLDFTNPRGVHIDEGSYVAFGAVVLSHDMTRLFHTDTYIGRNCFIGANSIIMPGVRIGDQCIVGSGAVVTRDVPSQSIVAGNPAVVIKSGIRTARWGIIEDRMIEVRADRR